MNQNEWINAKDRLPDKTGKYNCKMEIGSANIIEVERPSIFRIDENGGRFYAGDWVRVIYWMPLPDAPA